jgi:hypothetical protein
MRSSGKKTKTKKPHLCRTGQGKGLEVTLGEAGQSHLWGVFQGNLPTERLKGTVRHWAALGKTSVRATGLTCVVSQVKQTAFLRGGYQLIFYLLSVRWAWGSTHKKGGKSKCLTLQLPLREGAPLNEATETETTPTLPFLPLFLLQAGKNMCVCVCVCVCVLCIWGRSLSVIILLWKPSSRSLSK